MQDKKIMIVDDEMATLLPLKRSLEAEGYSVIEAVNGYRNGFKGGRKLPTSVVERVSTHSAVFGSYFFPSK